MGSASIPNNMDEHVFDIVSLAGRYFIYPLVRACENVMNRILSVNNVVQILIAVDRHQLNEELREIVISFMKDNIVAIMSSSHDWKLCMAEYPDLVNQFISDLADDRNRLAEEVKNQR